MQTLHNQVSLLAPVYSTRKLTIFIKKKKRKTDCTLDMSNRWCMMCGNPLFFSSTYVWSTTHQEPIPSVISCFPSFWYIVYVGATLPHRAQKHTSVAWTLPCLKVSNSITCLPVFQNWRRVTCKLIFYALYLLYLCYTPGWAWPLDKWASDTGGGKVSTASTN